MSVITRFWAWLTGEVKALPSIEVSIHNFADKVANDLKSFTAPGSVGSYLEGGIVAVAQVIDPALVPLISGVENYIPRVIGWITGVSDVAAAESGKSVPQQIEDGIAALESIKGIDGTVYAGLLATLQTAIANYVHTNNAVALGTVAPPAGQLLAIGQAVHAVNKDATGESITSGLNQAEAQPDPAPTPEVHDPAQGTLTDVSATPADPNATSEASTPSQPSSQPVDGGQPTQEESSSESEESNPSDEANTAPTSEAAPVVDSNAAEQGSVQTPPAEATPAQDLEFEEAIKQEKIKAGILNEDGTPKTDEEGDTPPAQ